MGSIEAWGAMWQSGTVIGAAAFLIGLLIGSFLNVCILRIPKEESIVRPPSHCPKCNAPIKPYDNIPVLSWLLLGGKCRN
jgi:leader peptidase (prepilin peptidase)/N-methyltransferase